MPHNDPWPSHDTPAIEAALAPLLARIRALEAQHQADDRDLTEMKQRIKDLEGEICELRAMVLSSLGTRHDVPRLAPLIGKFSETPVAPMVPMKDDDF